MFPLRVRIGVRCGLGVGKGWVARGGRRRGSPGPPLVVAVPAFGGWLHASSQSSSCNVNEEDRAALAQVPLGDGVPSVYPVSGMEDLGDSSARVCSFHNRVILRTHFCPGADYLFPEADLYLS